MFQTEIVGESSLFVLVLVGPGERYVDYRIHSATEQLNYIFNADCGYSYHFEKSNQIKIVPKVLIIYSESQPVCSYTI